MLRFTYVTSQEHRKGCQADWEAEPLWRQLLESIQTCQPASQVFCFPLDKSGSILFVQAFSGFQLPDRVMPTPMGLTSNTATEKG